MNNTPLIPDFLDIFAVFSQGDTTYLIVGDLTSHKHKCKKREQGTSAAYGRSNVIAINRMDGTTRCIGEGLGHDEAIDFTLERIAASGLPVKLA